MRTNRMNTDFSTRFCRFLGKTIKKTRFFKNLCMAVVGRSGHRTLIELSFVEKLDHFKFQLGSSLLCREKIYPFFRLRMLLNVEKTHKKWVFKFLLSSTFSSHLRRRFTDFFCRLFLQTFSLKHLEIF